MLLDTVRKTIEENALIKKGDTVLCAVSGGADSICLLYVMQALKDEYDLTVYVANINHLIRGEESDRDSNFVKSVCKAADVKCFYREYDVKSISKERKLSEEECGRILRYEFFSEISDSLGGAKIATAHNLNDNAETVIFRLIRGSSAQGISGIKYRRENIIRPLLDVSRDEIEKFLVLNGITWCEDSTNKLPLYARNKIRLSVLPKLREVSGGAERHIVSAAKLISEDNMYLSSIAENAERECFFDGYLLVDKLLENPVPIKRRIASSVLQKWNAREVTGEKIDKFLDFLTKESGKQFDINSVYYAEKSYQKVYLRKRISEENPELILTIGESCEDKNWRLTANIESYPIKRKSNNVAVFDADKLKLPLKIRYKRDGDKMILKGMKGTKKLSDIFSDEKVERLLRSDIPIVEKDGNILFLCGLRQSSLYNADTDTKKYLVIQYENNTKDNV